MDKIILFIHGMFCGPWVFEKIDKIIRSADLKTEFAILPFHGPDDQISNTISTFRFIGMSRYRKRVIEIIDTIRRVNPQAKIILCGHSMGGLLALMCANHQKISSVIAITPANPAGIIPLKFSAYKTFWSVITRHGIFPYPNFRKESFLISKKSFAYGFANMFNEDQINKTYDKLIFESGQALFEIGFPWLDRHKTTRMDFDIHQPVLLISGTKDRVTPEKMIKKICQRIKKAKTENGDNSITKHQSFIDGHMITLGENYESLAKEIITFVNNYC